MPHATQDSRPSPIPLEASGDRPWLVRCGQTLAALVRHPWRSFDLCPEPIEHGRVLRYLATLRLPPWILLVIALAFQQATNPEGSGMPMRSIYAFIEPSLARVISAWIVLMIPVGLPMLYFVLGLAAHIGVALTGGASRSIGASMRACGYVLGLMLLIVGVVDIPLYLGHMSGVIYLGALAVMAVVHWVLVGLALARTHRISVGRGWVAAILPTLVFVAITLARAILELSVVPGLDPPGGPYALP